jgi:hypothetical protein
MYANEPRKCRCSPAQCLCTVIPHPVNVNQERQQHSLRDNKEQTTQQRAINSTPLLHMHMLSFKTARRLQSMAD